MCSSIWTYVKLPPPIKFHDVPFKRSVRLVVPAANIPSFMASDAGHEMAKGQPFSACYCDTPEGRDFSLRSEGDFDVSVIAAQYGGGGHKNAAGFSISLAEASMFELPSSG